MHNTTLGHVRFAGAMGLRETMLVLVSTSIFEGLANISVLTAFSATPTGRTRAPTAIPGTPAGIKAVLFRGQPVLANFLLVPVKQLEVFPVEYWVPRQLQCWRGRGSIFIFLKKDVISDPLTLTGIG